MLEPRALLAGTGLTGQYFHNANFTGLAAERTEAVDFAWGTAAPAPGVDADSFSVRWIGQLEPKFSETYTLRTISDEGVRLWIGGQLVIDNWAPHSAVVNSTTVALQAGQRYDVRLEYFDGSGTAQVRLQWTSASQPLEAIAAANLYASPEGLAAAYANAGAVDHLESIRPSTSTGVRGRRRRALRPTISAHHGRATFAAISAICTHFQSTRAMACGSGWATSW